MRLFFRTCLGRLGAIGPAAIALAIATALQPCPAVHAAAVHDAAQAGDVAALAEALEEDADAVRSTDYPQLMTPLHLAAGFGRWECVTLLLDHDADMEARTENGLTGLHLAAQAGHLRIVATLLDAGGDIDARANDGSSALHLAIIHDHRIVASFLLDRSADPNLPGKDALTPLHLAAQRNWTDVARMLLDRGARADAVAAGGMTPLQLAAASGYAEMVSLLGGSAAPLPQAATATSPQVPADRPARDAKVPGPREVAPTATHWVQLAAMPTSEEARTEWHRLVERHESLFLKLEPTLIPAKDRRGRPIVRLRVGPLPRDQARDLCRSLRSRGEDCFTLSEGP